MQDQFSPEAWKAEIVKRKGQTFKDSLAFSTMKFISFHVFKTANAPDWPQQHIPEVFGACRINSKIYRVCRNLHGYNIIFAQGCFLPAHAARLSDMVEAVFGKYRLELARAKWNFSAEAARLDLEREPLITTALKELETILVFKRVLPPSEQMEALRSLVEPRGAARPDAIRPKRIEVLEAKASKTTQRLDELESAMVVRLDELDLQISETRKESTEMRDQVKDTINRRIVAIEERLEELLTLIKKVDAKTARTPL